jgi:hypothetical protein
MTRRGVAGSLRILLKPSFVKVLADHGDDSLHGLDVHAHRVPTPSMVGGAQPRHALFRTRKTLGESTASVDL